MLADEILREIEARGIALTPALNQWFATVDQKGVTRSSRSRKVRQISAQGVTPIVAIRNLCALLDQTQERALFEEEVPF